MEKCRKHAIFLKKTFLICYAYIWFYFLLSHFFAKMEREMANFKLPRAKEEDKRALLLFHLMLALSFEKEEEEEEAEDEGYQEEKKKKEEENETEENEVEEKKEEEEAEYGHCQKLRESSLQNRFSNKTPKGRDGTKL
jgi:hypothetical protein